MGKLFIAALAVCVAILLALSVYIIIL